MFGRTSQSTEMKTIGIAGAGKGVGTTHLCITLAGRLKAAGNKVAILEDNRSGDFAEIAENLNIQIRGDGFVYKGIDYYVYHNPRNLMAIKYENYDYLIVDYGNYADCDKDFFAMNTTNIIVASSRYWNFSNLIINVFNIEKNDVFEKYNYVFPFAKNNDNLQKEISDAMDSISHLYFTSYNEDPFTDFDVPELDELLNIKTEEIKSKKGLFFLNKNKKKNKTVEEEEESSHENQVEYEYPDEDDEKRGNMTIRDMGEAAASVLNEYSSSPGGYMPMPQIPKPVPAQQPAKREEQKPEPMKEQEIKVPDSVAVLPPTKTYYTDEAMELLDMTKFIVKCIDFDIIKNHENKDALTELLKKQMNLAVDIAVKNNAEQKISGDIALISGAGKEISINKKYLT